MRKKLIIRTERDTRQDVWDQIRVADKTSMLENDVCGPAVLWVDTELDVDEVKNMAQVVDVVLSNIRPEAFKGQYWFSLDGPLLRKQRAVLDKYIGKLANTCSDYAMLHGLANLLDDIADQAHDKYGIDCLLTREGK